VSTVTVTNPVTGAAATIAVTPTTPPPTTTLIGTSPGGGVAQLTAQLHALPRCQVVRVYSGDAPTTVAADPVFAAAAAAGCEVWYSFATMPASGTSFAAALKDWMGAGVHIRWTYCHEADKPKVTPAVFQSNWATLLGWAEAVPGYVTSRVADQTILMGYVLEPSQPHGPPDAYYVPATSRLGFDCYQPQAFGNAVAYARAKGKPWVVPEFGAGGPQDPKGSGDANALAFTKNAFAAMAAYPPEGACWYASTQGGMSDTLTNLPKTAAYLASLIP
jgi:hypothetical protein